MSLNARQNIPRMRNGSDGKEYSRNIQKSKQSSIMLKHLLNEICTLLISRSDSTCEWERSKLQATLGRERVNGQLSTLRREGRELYHCIRIYIPVPCPRLVFNKVESPEKVHCVEHLREGQC